LATLREVPVIDAVYIITDDKNLMDRKDFCGADVRPLAPRLARHPFHFLTYEFWRFNYELHGLKETFPLGDVHFFLGWRTPLLKPITLENMYHSLMEDGGASRIVPILPVDPHLYTRLPGLKRYFPVWCAPGLDRQLAPQLYRVVNVCVIHTKRLLEIIPHTKGYRVTREEGLEIKRESDFELVEFYFQRRAGADISLPNGNEP